MRHFLEVDDLTPAELVAGARPGRRAPHWPTPLAGKGVGARVREAVGAHAELDGDGRRAARRPSGDDPARRGRPRHSRDGRGRDAARSRASTPSIAARVFEHHKLERMAAVSPVPVVNLLVGRWPSDAGAGRSADDPRGVGLAAGPHDRLRRRRQQRGPLLRHRRRHVRHAGPHRDAGRLRALRQRHRPHRQDRYRAALYPRPP